MIRSSIKPVRTEWRNVVLVCAKCTKKLGGGFGAKGKARLARALREEAGLAKGRKGAAGVIEVPCLKICPKRAVTVVDGRKPGSWLVVAGGTPVRDVAERLGLLDGTDDGTPAAG